jgi:ubiquinone/menaquinone biosynthesis C-methylase UbiE
VSYDVDAFRADSRKGWGSVAGGWEKWAPTVRDVFMPVTVWVLDHARLYAGATVLELAAGTGEVGLMAHELIQPGGALVMSDFAPEMLSAAQRQASERGADDIRFKQIDMESIDVEAASQDAVLCRFGLMFLPDPEASLREIRRVLRSGGRLAAATWSPAAENPWSSVVEKTMVQLGLAERGPAGQPGQFALDDPAALAEMAAAAGFEDVEVEPIAFTMADTFDDWWARTTGMSRAGQRIAGLTDEQRQYLIAALLENVAKYEDDEGVLQLPACALGLAAGA